jgi:hypothetical protein
VRPDGATWRSGYATVCKTVYTSSILVVASNNFKYLGHGLKSIATGLPPAVPRTLANVASMISAARLSVFENIWLWTFRVIAGEACPIRRKRTGAVKTLGTHFRT